MGARGAAPLSMTVSGHRSRSCGDPFPFVNPDGLDGPQSALPPGRAARTHSRLHAGNDAERRSRPGSCSRRCPRSASCQGLSFSAIVPLRLHAAHPCAKEGPVRSAPDPRPREQGTRGIDWPRCDRRVSCRARGQGLSGEDGETSASSNPTCVEAPNRGTPESGLWLIPDPYHWRLCQGVLAELLSSTAGMTSPARSARIRSPAARPSAVTYAALWRVAGWMVPPSRVTGSSSATGVNRPERPTPSVMARSVVTA